MLVKAVPGTKCPKEGKPREYITDQIPAEVTQSAYYLRLIADGSLTVIPGRDALQGAQAGIQEARIKPQVPDAAPPASAGRTTGVSAGEKQKTKKEKKKKAGK